jgi:hypothetical protein
MRNPTSELVLACFRPHWTVGVWISGPEAMYFKKGTIDEYTRIYPTDDRASAGK